MKKHLPGPVSAALTFIIAVVLSSPRLHGPQRLEEPVQPPKEIASSPMQAVCATSDSSQQSCLDLIDDNIFHSKLNGWKLPQGGEPLSEDDIGAAKIIPLSSGGLLSGTGSVLSKLNSQKHIVWEYPVSQWLIDFEVVESTGLVYGIAGDNIMFILDLYSGRELKVISRNGSAAYGQVETYRKNECLITDNFWAYREKAPPGSEFEPMQDGITAWRGTRLLWHLDFPADAELVVKGNRIFAVTKTKTTIYVKEIFPPSKSSEARQ